MAWTLNGTYFENCSCDTICPCTWSGFKAHATHDRCLAMLAFHIEQGDIEGVDVSGLSFALVLDTPPVMSDGNWRVGVLLDGAASSDQAGALGRVLAGQLGGPPAMLGPLIGEMVGVEQVPAEWHQQDDTISVRFGDRVDVEVAVSRAGGLTDAVQLVNVFHPAAATLTVAPATRSRVDAFGISFGETGTSGFTAPFSWAA
ncbi:MAG: DUF1326 domain-containing protein [Acidimicrobiales bacterium]